MKKFCAGFLILFIILIAVYACKCDREHAQVGTLVTLHYTDWCPACQVMKPIWAQVETEIKSTNPSIMFKKNNEDKHRTPDVHGYPTIRLLDSTGRRYTYPGGPNAATLKTWILAPVH